MARLTADTAQDNHDAEAFLKPVSRTDVPDYYDGTFVDCVTSQQRCSAAFKDAIPTSLFHHCLPARGWWHLELLLRSHNSRSFVVLMSNHSHILNACDNTCTSRLEYLESL